MSDSYKSIIDSFDNLLLELNNIFEPRTPNVQQQIGNYLISLYLEPGPQIISFSHKGVHQEKKTIEEFMPYYNIKNVYELKKLYHYFDNPNIKAEWISEPVKNWEFIRKIDNFHGPTVKTLEFCRGENLYNYVKNGILNVFFRLTNYNNGSMIPIQDLVDLPTAVLMTEKMGYLKQEHQRKNQNFFSLYYWGLAVEGILFTLLNMEATFPAPYYPGLSVLEKKDTLAKALVDLELSFAKKPYSDSKLD